MTNTDSTEALKQLNETLRTEVAALRARLDQVEAALPKPKPGPVQHEPPRVVIHAGPMPRVPLDGMPDDQQLARLQEIVLQKYPVLIPQGPQALPMDQFAQHFKLSFAWLLIADRREAPNSKYAIGYWIDQAARFHKRLGLGPKPFVTACIAVGDLAFSPIEDVRYVSVGLVDGVFRDVDRVDLTAGWRRVLDGKMLAPIPLYPQSVVAPPRRMIHAGA
jgi:hypothetical protein